MTTPDHVENTGDNLRHAAEVQEQEADKKGPSPTEAVAEYPLPDFNT